MCILSIYDSREVVPSFVGWCLILEYLLGRSAAKVTVQSWSCYLHHLLQGFNIHCRHNRLGPLALGKRLASSITRCFILLIDYRCTKFKPFAYTRKRSALII
ncbi:hypothetical protein CW304_01925 [Bacillus sp. UFRGS-B20]|nr:hypothetical protein CW304_01925 [Bacillus sp. UFRGS-B20]